jgi:DNA mismatch repair ATPase MutS
VRTVHFSDRIEGGKMVFDYKLKPGVVQSTNAIRLMKAVGIDVDYGV